MSRKIILVDGPPGCGKTWKLQQYFIAAAQRVGPKKVGAITFTRSAAEELRLRAGAALGIGKDPKTLRREMPFVGTIHGLAYALIDRPKVVGWKEIKEFCKAINQPEPKYVQDQSDLDAFQDMLDREQSPVALMRQALSSSRHRKCNIKETLSELIPPTKISLYRPELMEYLAREYTRWKTEMGLVDYDDMLEAGRHLTLPVKVLMVDEAQDCSPLLWETVDNWSKTTGVYICTGDAFQSLYSYMGGDPQLFIGHPGEWNRLTMSHRVSTATAEYARRVLVSAGWTNLVNMWEGEGGEPKDGTELWIARTNALADAMASILMEQSEPFTRLKDWSEWTSDTALAYKLISQLKRGSMVQGISALSKGAAYGLLSRGVQAKVESKDGEVLDLSDVERILGMRIDYYRYRAPDTAEWLAAIEEKHGEDTLYKKPKVQVSTIHGAKGREADKVVLAMDWGSIPGKLAATPGDPARREGCCAYVAVTRHRSELQLLDLGLTQKYNFPPRS